MNSNNKYNNNSSVDKNEAKRWLIIGAYQAGASNRRIAKMCGISQQSVRRIILNFKRTGSPSIPKSPTKREKSKLIIEYDEHGNIIDSEDEEQKDDSEVISSLKEKIRARRPSAKDLITYVLNKAQKMEQKEQREKIIPCNDNWRPPTPPRDISLQRNSIQLDPFESSSTRTSTFSPPLSEPSKSPKHKDDMIIKGFEAWTIEDDRILLTHVLTRLSKCRWKEAEAKLKGRHSAELCEKRWELLRNLLIRSTQKSGTRGW
ncbi:uncharacterized protein BX663DRAFT_494387 [Cokeromyces recurvatus]|uniref:uncharacterized protein n=1 Tax=Cokeromyces recurvatus TaxID=90255 RepID=UPI0022211595|nr:uncharacterized protein BX663DRAFT_494387 [Cokeromyces recurvatus]KAI7906973.1 hypothetical protein BX663DRAFT_494387 [Cokeromyces recurvatus]